jgi:spermidine/putrescine transport system substrate-binding protein
VRVLAAIPISVAAALLLAGCGSGGGTQAVAPPPKSPEAPASGTLHVFTYEDTVAPDLMKPFERQNPDLDVQTASFGSDEEAAAKLGGGFRADVIESCLDEMGPLMARKLLRPIDTGGVPDWNDLVFTDAKGVRRDGKVWVVPLSAGPQGLIVNTRAIPNPPASWKALFDPRYKGRVALEGDYELPAIAETALVLGIKDPMHLSQSQLDRVSSYLDAHHDQFRSLWQTDSDLVNLFKSGEVVLSDGGPGVAQRMVEAGVPVKWISPKERPLSWVCGLSISSNAQNIPAAYKLINWQASPRAQAIRAKDGYVVTNPKAIPLSPPSTRKVADPSSIRAAIPETQRPLEDQWVHIFQEFQAQ